MPTGPGDLERGDAELAEDLVARERELGADENHVHRQPAAAGLDENLLRRRHHLGGRTTRCVRPAERVEAVDVDAHAVAHRLELRVGLHRACVVELDIPVDELGGAAQRGVVADGHDVVEAVHADALPAQPVGEKLARAVDELLVGDDGVAVQADVARLAREHDGRLALDGDDDVCVAMDDREAGHVRDRSLEARVLGAADERSVEAVALERSANVRVPPCYVVHEASTPFTSAQIAWFSGVGTPCSRPKRTIPPLR